MLVISSVESISKFGLICKGKTFAVVDLLEKVGLGIKLVVDLFLLALKSFSHFLVAVEVVNFLESLIFVHESKSLSEVISLMLYKESCYFISFVQFLEVSFYVHFY